MTLIEESVVVDPIGAAVAAEADVPPPLAEALRGLFPGRVVTYASGFARLPRDADVLVVARGGSESYDSARVEAALSRARTVVSWGTTPPDLTLTARLAKRGGIPLSTRPGGLAHVLVGDLNSRSGAPLLPLSAAVEENVIDLLEPRSASSAGECPWAGIVTAGGLPENHDPVFLLSTLRTQAVKSGATLHKRDLSGNTYPERIAAMPDEVERVRGLRKEVTACLVTCGMRPLEEEVEGSHWSATFSGASGGLYVRMGRRSGSAYLRIFDEAACTKVADALAEFFPYVEPVPEPPHVRGVVNMLVQSRGEIYLRPVGVAGVSLERGNYNEDVLSGYDHVLADMATATPCGRLALFDGIPGSGKTFLIRAMLKLVKTAGFIIVPPTMVESLGNPEIIPALASAARDMPNGRMVFLIEDADECLTSRTVAVDQHRSNVKALSSLLNMSDGIPGAMFDIRVIASTNADLQAIDPAVTRDGRLCRRVAVNALTPERANAVLRRLLPAFPTAVNGKLAEPFTIPTTLASVYRRARDLGWAPSEEAITASVLPQPPREP